MGRRSTKWCMLAALVCALVCTPGTASAADAYTVQSWQGCAGGFNSGSFDTRGRTYVPCGNPTTIGVYAPDGSLERTIALTRFVTDVEPVGDGSLLYLAGYDAPQRLARQADGSYALDATWHPEAYPMYGNHYPAAGLFVDSDAAGNVYYADGYWASGRHTIVEYDPAGHFVTRFGQYAKESWAAGDFYWALGGIAVSPDGLRVINTESGNNRLDVWTRDTPGVAFTEPPTTFGGTQANNADRAGYCDYVGWEEKFAAPYDVALDADGNVYVINTTCKQLLRFTPDLATLTANVDVRVLDSAGHDIDVRPHGFAVGADGTVFIGQNRRVLVPSGSQAVVAAPPIALVPAAAPPQTPPAHASTTTPAAPAAVSRPRLHMSFGLRRPYTARSRTTQLVYLALRCSATCATQLRVRAGGRVIATFRVGVRAGSVKMITLHLPRRRSGKMLVITAAARTAAGARASAAHAYAIAA